MQEVGSQRAPRYGVTMATLNLWNMDDERAEQWRREAGARSLTFAELGEKFIVLHAALREQAKTDKKIAALLEEHDLAALGV